VIQEPTAAKLYEAMGRVIGDPELRARLREASLRCAEKFRWEATARQTMAVLERALDARPV
jgi:glycosyltransferase involved in cell wall biosynthesis